MVDYSPQKIGLIGALQGALNPSAAGEGGITKAPGTELPLPCVLMAPQSPTQGHRPDFHSLLT